MEKKEKEKQKPAPFIMGENVDLVALNPDHIEFYNRWNNDPRVRRYSRNPLPRTIEDQKKWLFREQEGPKEHIAFEVWHKKDKRPIGIGGLGRINWLYRNANIWLSIGEPEYWNQNIGTEASKMIIEYGFNELNLHKIYAGVFSPNKGSLRCAEKDGFIPELIEKDACYVDGEYVDHHRFRLLKEEWLKLKKQG